MCARFCFERNCVDVAYMMGCGHDISPVERVNIKSGSPFNIKAGAGTVK
jgi:hypothetical protein